MDPIEAAMRRDAPTGSTQGLVFLMAILFLAVFGFLLWFFVGKTSTRPQNSTQTLPNASFVLGPAPLPPSTKRVPVPNALNWTQSTPKVVRPPFAFQKTLNQAVNSATDTITLNSQMFLQLDPNVALTYPFYTVFVVPANTPSHVTKIKDLDSCTQRLDNPLTCGIMPDISYDNTLRVDMTSINLTGPYQMCFGIQNRAAHKINFLLNSSQNVQFEVPSGKTAVFFSQSNFWNVLLFRQNNPMMPFSPQASMDWRGAIVPDRDGAQPLASVVTNDEALRVAAAEVEAVQAARNNQNGGLTA